MKTRVRAAGKVFLAAALFLAGMTWAIGQPPPDRDARRGEPRIDPAVEVWIKTLAEKITDRHDTIRDSAREGLVAAGRAALPTLRRLAEGDDGATAEAARKLIGRIESGERGFGFGGGPRSTEGPGGPDRAGFGRPAGERPGDRPGAERPGGDRPGAERPGFGGPAPGGRPVIEEAIRSLELNDGQRGKVREIMEGHGRKMRELSEKAREGKFERAEMREAMEKVHDELIKQMKDVLTKEQMEKLEKALRDAPPGRPGGFEGRPGDRRPEGPRPGDRPPDRPRQ